jgi:hypothetical protein
LYISFELPFKALASSVPVSYPFLSGQTLFFITVNTIKSTTVIGSDAVDHALKFVKIFIYFSLNYPPQSISYQSINQSIDQSESPV